MQQRFIVLTFDKDSQDACNSNSVKHCINMPLPFDDMPNGEFGKAAYVFLTYFKHPLMYEALQVANEIFFFDADILILSNPFAEVYVRRTDEGLRYADNTTDLYFQRDGGRGPGCAG